MPKPTVLGHTYLADLKRAKREYPDAEFVVVTRTARSVLAPSAELLLSWKSGQISWQEYERRFKGEILSNQTAVDELERIAETVAGGNDVFLVCYEKTNEEAYQKGEGGFCHRFILLDMLAPRVLAKRAAKTKATKAKPSKVFTEEKHSF